MRWECILTSLQMSLYVNICEGVQSILDSQPQHPRHKPLPHPRYATDIIIFITTDANHIIGLLAGDMTSIMSVWQVINLQRGHHASHDHVRHFWRLFEGVCFLFVREGSVKQLAVKWLAHWQRLSIPRSVFFFF